MMVIRSYGTRKNSRMWTNAKPHHAHAHLRLSLHDYDWQTIERMWGLVFFQSHHPSRDFTSIAGPFHLFHYILLEFGQHRFGLPIETCVRGDVTLCVSFRVWNRTNVSSVPMCPPTTCFRYMSSEKSPTDFSNFCQICPLFCLMGFSLIVWISCRISTCASTSSLVFFQNGCLHIGLLITFCLSIE